MRTTLDFRLIAAFLASDFSLLTSHLRLLGLFCNLLNGDREGGGQAAGTLPEIVANSNADPSLNAMSDASVTCAWFRTLAS